MAVVHSALGRPWRGLFADAVPGAQRRTLGCLEAERGGTLSSRLAVGESEHVGVNAAARPDTERGCGLARDYQPLRDDDRDGFDRAVRLGARRDPP